MNVQGLNDYRLWGQLAASLVASVAESRGANKDAVAYLSLLAIGLRSSRLTDKDLQTLKQTIESDIASNRPVTSEQLNEIDRRIRETSAAIQSTAPGESG